MEEEYTENGRKVIKPEYKNEEKLTEPPIIMEIENEMGTYKVERETTISPENILKPKIKREGDKMCWCGSGKKFEDCHGKHLRVDKNPGASVEEYQHELNPRRIDEYETPESEKEYKVEEEEGESKSDDVLALKEQKEEEKEEKSSEYKKGENDEEES